HSEVRAVVADARYRGELSPAVANTSGIGAVAWRGDASSPLPSPPQRGGGCSVARDGRRRSALSGPVPSFAELGTRACPGPPKIGPEPDYVVAIMYTSGTTGPPKGVMLSDPMCQAAGRTAALVADVRAGDVLFLWEPFYHIAGVQAVTLC